MATAKLKAVISAEDRASAVLKGISGSIGKMSAAVGIGTLAANAATKAYSAMKTGIADAIGASADFEQTRIGLENMLGSADKARVLLKDISKFAADTPFEFPELAQATRQLVAFGFSAEDAFSTMKGLGDVSAAIGTPIGEIAYLMGTLRTQGRAFTIDIRQFAMRGIPIYEYLAKVLKTNENNLSAMIEQGKVGFPEVQKAFQMMTAEGGKFHNTMAKQSKSLNGLLSTLRDNLGMIGRRMLGITEEGDVVAGGIFDRMRNAVQGLIDYLQSPGFNAAFKNLTDWLAVNIPKAIDWITNVGMPFLKTAFDTLWPVVEIVLGWLKQLFNYAKDHEWVIYALVAAFGALKLAMALPGALTAFQAVMGGVKLSYLGMKLLVTSSITMPAIGVAAAIFALGLVLIEAKRTWDAIQGADNALKVFIKSSTDVVSRMNAIINSSVYSPEAKAHARKVIESVASFRADGGTVTADRPYIVGERGPELFVPGKTGTVVPNNQLGAGATHFHVNIGLYAGSEMEKRRVAQELMRAYQEAMA